MNKERLEQVEQWLLAGAPERTFNMNRLVEVPEGERDNWCGTACCIAGYVFQQEVAFDPQLHVGNHFGIWMDVEAVAGETLGLSPEVAAQLFFIENGKGRAYTGVWEDVTPQEAAQAVRNVIVHGEPRWEEILEDF